MTIRKIMAPFTALASCDAVFVSAAAVAKRFDALIDVVHVRQRPKVTGDFYYPVGMTYVEQNVDTLNAKADELALKLENRFLALCAEHRIDLREVGSEAVQGGPAATWTAFDGDLLADLAYRARVADLTIVAPPSTEPPFGERTFCEEMVFQSGRPVLIGGRDPDDGVMRDFPKTVFVAWDGKREAARALHAALPILKACDLVIVGTAGDTEWAVEAPKAAEEYLRLHGVNATHLHLHPPKDAPPEEALLEHAKKKGADLIVMGAYSHQRWRQIVLGGFTRHLLKTSEIPLLMAH